MTFRGTYHQRFLTAPGYSEVGRCKLDPGARLESTRFEVDVESINGFNLNLVF